MKYYKLTFVVPGTNWTIIYYLVIMEQQETFIYVLS